MHIISMEIIQISIVGSAVNLAFSWVNGTHETGGAECSYYYYLLYATVNTTKTR